MILKRFTFFSTLVVILFCFSCDNDNDQQAEDLQALFDFQNEIVALANTSVCDNGLEFQCRSSAFGVNSCGGPLSFILYSTSIDTEIIEEMIANFNQQQLEYNQQYEVVVSCLPVVAPSFVGCVEGHCAVQD